MYLTPHPCILYTCTPPNLRTSRKSQTSRQRQAHRQADTGRQAGGHRQASSQTSRQAYWQAGGNLAGRDRHTGRQTQAGKQADTGKQAAILASKKGCNRGRSVINGGVVVRIWGTWESSEPAIKLVERPPPHHPSNRSFVISRHKTNNSERRPTYCIGQHNTTSDDLQQTALIRTSVRRPAATSDMCCIDTCCIISNVILSLQNL